MSAAAKLFPEPECACGLLLDAMGRCWACDTSVRISPATTDLAGLLAAPSFVHQSAAVITTVDGELTLSMTADGLRLNAERFSGALAAVVLDEPQTVALAGHLLNMPGRHLLCIPLSLEGSDAGRVTLWRVEGGTRLELERQGGALARVTLDDAAALDLVTELMLSLRRRHWGAL